MSANRTHPGDNKQQTTRVGANSPGRKEETRTRTAEDDATKQKKTSTVDFYKRTREEALRCVNTIPSYKLYDLETGFMKEKYRRRRAPSPPTGTTVYEVGTGRSYKYTSGLMRLYPGSVAYENAKRAAAEAKKVKRPPVDRGDSCASGSFEAQKRRRCCKQQTEAAAAAVKGTHSEEPSSLPVGGLRRTIPLPLHTSSATSTAVQQQEIKNCDCVTLVTADTIHINLYKPDLAGIDYREVTSGEVSRLLSESPTLRYLCDGYRNYVENNLLDDVHTLTAYTCRSSTLNLFSVYKTISCKHQQPAAHFNDLTGQGTSVPEQSRSPLHTTIAIISQYLYVFSALADFNYTCIVPSLRVGLCNALVVDKRWTYSPVRQLYLPTYHLLAGDSYTDLAVREIRKMNNRGTTIKYIRFMSTSNTVLYTNRRALLVRNDKGTNSTATANKDIVRPIVLPPKKRLTTLYREKSARAANTCPPTPSTSTDSHLQEFVREHGLEERTYPLNIKPSGLTTPSDDISDELNPTLIVFKHNLNEKEADTLLCNIMLEISLTNTLQYSK